MSEIQSKIVGAITVLPENGRKQVWDFIQDVFGTEDNLSEEEIEAKVMIILF
ncbi:MAG: hypothetical protein FWF50_03400 [Defluviitaleaceae bacterium]|nr:hypothetical protein [Defluviitaleaceae bacterium]